MAAAFGGKSLLLRHGAKDGFVRVQKRDLEKLTTEVMQLKEFLPRVLNGDMIAMLHKARAAQSVKDQLMHEQEQLRQERLHLQSRLEALQAECQKEREEKLQLRDQLWQSTVELQQQADFCSGLGSAACGLLWSCSAGEDTVTRWLADGKLQSFLNVAGQTLESFVRSLGNEVKGQTEDHNSQEHQFVLAIAGTITNVVAVACGRDFLSNSARVLLDTLMKLLELMKPGVFPRLKALMLMALYNISINVEGLKYISGNQGLLPLIRTLLEEADCEVCVHALRLLQSLLLEPEALRLLGPSLLEPQLQSRLSRLASSRRPGLRESAQQALDDLLSLQQGRGCKQIKQSSMGSGF